MLKDLLTAFLTSGFVMIVISIFIASLIFLPEPFNIFISSFVGLFVSFFVILRSTKV